MKKVFILILFAAGFVSVSQLSAQALIDEAVLQRLQLNQTVREEIRALVVEQIRMEQELSADQNILQARLQRMLIDEDPDMKQVENLLRESLELRLKEQMGRITRTREMRKLMGEDQWALFLRTRAEIRERIENRLNDNSPDRSGRLENSQRSGPDLSGSAGRR